MSIITTEVSHDKQEKTCYPLSWFKEETLKNGDKHNLKAIAASMMRQDMTPKATRKLKCTTDNKHKMLVAPNLLTKGFDTTEPNKQWAGDITYLAIGGGWLNWRSLLICTHVRRSTGLWIPE